MSPEKQSENRADFAKVLRTTTIPQAFFGPNVDNPPDARCAFQVYVAHREELGIMSFLNWETNYGMSSGHISTIIHMNDRERKSFAEIADYVDSIGATQ